jgi:hypothetical protein
MISCSVASVWEASSLTSLVTASMIAASFGIKIFFLAASFVSSNSFFASLSAALCFATTCHFSFSLSASADTFVIIAVKSL